MQSGGRTALSDFQLDDGAAGAGAALRFAIAGGAGRSQPLSERFSLVPLTMSSESQGCFPSMHSSRVSSQDAQERSGKVAKE